MKNRHAHLDIAKGIGIIAIALGHNWLSIHAHPLLQKTLYAFHVPLFFMISGLFLKHSTPMKTFVHKRFNSLIIPYIITVLILAVLNYMTRKNPFPDYVSSHLYATGNSIQWPPLWFLPHLFILSLFVLFLCKRLNLKACSDSQKYTLLSFMLIIGFVFLANFNKFLGTIKVPYINNQSLAHIGLPWGIELIPITAFFFFIGYFFKEKVINLQFCPKSLLMTLIIFIILISLPGDAIDLQNRQYPNIWKSTLLALSGSYAILQFSAFLSTQKKINTFLSLIGQSSLLILILHGEIQYKIFYQLTQRFDQSPHLIAYISFFASWLIPAFIYRIYLKVKNRNQNKKLQS